MTGMEKSNVVSGKKVIERNVLTITLIINIKDDWSISRTTVKKFSEIPERENLTNYIGNFFSLCMETIVEM